MSLSIRSLCSAAVISIFVFAAQPAKADVQKMQFEVVGTSVSYTHLTLPTIYSV